MFRERIDVRVLNTGTRNSAATCDGIKTAIRYLTTDDKIFSIFFIQVLVMEYALAIGVYVSM